MKKIIHTSVIKMDEDHCILIATCTNGSIWMMTIGLNPIKWKQISIPGKVKGINTSSTQISTKNFIIVAICDDGSIWGKQIGEDVTEWGELPSLPD